MSRFGLFLFARDPALVREATTAGIDAFVVDWEQRGKRDRQAGADTEIRSDTPDDLAAVRKATDKRVVCRVDGPGEETADEIEKAIELGADEVLLPMVRRSEEVELVLEQVAGRCGLGILVETDDAVRSAAALGALPLSRVYVGLNDLMIDRGSSSIFEPLVDGTLERVREHFRMPFGVAGLTHPEFGNPVPCRLLIGEMARLDCDFSFLRRSFLRDVQRGLLDQGVAAIRAAMEEAVSRSHQAVAEDRDQLVSAVGNKLTL